jgi:SAM-dependent methyltransferase
LAEGIRLSYQTWLAEHCHVLWTSNASPQPQIPAHASGKVRELPVMMFNQALAPLKRGRFYPARVLNSDEQLPGALFRVLELSSDSLRADFNHPLAGRKCKLGMATGSDRARGNANPEALLNWAGIDTPLPAGEVDYSDTYAFTRDDDAPDSVFYTTPRRVMHIDNVCAERITAFYRNHLRARDTVLDLMAGWHSHLADHAGDIIGLGMNAEEMADNPQLRSHVVHDLNATPRLALDDASFDVVVNTVSIEYLTQPLAVLHELRRILKPGGKLLITFSNRFFPPKVIALWKQLHPVERLNWVAQLVHQAGFSEIQTRMERGLERDTADTYYPQLTEMDPMFGVSACKQG